MFKRILVTPFLGMAVLSSVEAAPMVKMVVSSQSGVSYARALAVFQALETQGYMSATAAEEAWNTNDLTITQIGENTFSVVTSGGIDITILVLDY